MMTFSIVLLFAVCAVLTTVVLADSLARAIPAWRETKAALAACPDSFDAFVTIEDRFIRPSLPKARTRIFTPVTGKRRALRSQELNAAA